MTTKTITKTITLCDGCGKDLTGNFQHTYRLNLETESWSEYHNEKHQNVVKLEFCESCAREIKASLKKIEEALDE
ncbi:MAG: hypothetical protein Q4A13_10815 [Fretibacterium sp.]|nr:hypothetical protein [Fretibacterium sp.]